MFELDVHPEKRRVEIRVGNFLDLDLLARAERRLREETACILRHHPNFDMLVCASGAGPAPQEASAKMDEMFVTFFGNRLRKGALVDFDPLAMLQIRRVTNKDPRFNFFADRAAAEKWLDE